MPPDEAINVLKSAGLHAFPREWAIGSSIAVGNGRSQNAGITSFDELLYIFHVTNGTWCILDCSHQIATEERLETLSLAVDRILERMRRGNERANHSFKPTSIRDAD